MRVIFLAASLGLSACAIRQWSLTLTRDQQGHSAPSKFTSEANQAVAQALPIADQQDFEDAGEAL